MSREVFEELKQDEAFVEKVANRIYTESDDFEDSMPEPEWICEMTDIADKYIQRFKLAFKLANKVSNQPTLNENQQIVLEWLKREHFDSYIKSVLSNLYFYVNMTAIGDLENKEIQEMVNAYEKLSQEDFAQVLQAFSTWALEQEAE